MIYFDHNATTPMDDRVVEVMAPFLAKYYGNPSSLYRWGRIARDAIEQARAQVASLVNATPNQVIFTSGGTEANNLALQGWMRKFPGGKLAVSAIEHSSVLETAQGLQQQGWQTSFIPVQASGVISADALDELLDDSDIQLVSCMAANNETGVVQPVAELAQIARQHNTLFHSDAVQAAGKLPLDFPGMGVQMMTLSAHKIYGPKGVGALIVDKNLELMPLLYGGGQERRLRGGTENVAGIIGFGKAAELVLQERESQAKHLLSLRQRLEAGLMAIPGVEIFAQQIPRLPNTIQFGVNGVDGEMLVMSLDRVNIAVSSGSACASGGSEPSHVLVAMGVEENLARSAVRISLGKDNTANEVERFLLSLQSILQSFGVI